MSEEVKKEIVKVSAKLYAAMLSNPNVVLGLEKDGSPISQYGKGKDTLHKTTLITLCKRMAQEIVTGEDTF